MVKNDGKFAWTAKIGEKGQFVIPKDVREAMGINPGDTVLVLADPKKGIAIPPKTAFESLTAGLFGEGKL